MAFEAAFREFADKGADVDVDTRQITVDTGMTPTGRDPQAHPQPL